MSLEGKMEGQARLYEAYNELHGLAQEFKKPLDALTVLVFEHQIYGKSALVEALMGFQINHVGGRTKTRRPITLHIKYDPDCEVPLCHLVFDDDPTVADEKCLQEIQLCSSGILDEQRKASMNSVNPEYVLRNYLCQSAIDAAEQSDFGEARRILKVMEQPYDDQPGMKKYARLPPA